MPLVRRALDDGALVAVCRRENGGDVQPHPSFCALRMSEWRPLIGDWSSGYHWPMPGGGLTTDVGGDLLRALERAGRTWTPVRRSNRVDLTPSGSASTATSSTTTGRGSATCGSHGPTWVTLRPGAGATSVPSWRAVRQVDLLRIRRYRERVAHASQQLAEDMYGRIRDDLHFYRPLLDPAVPVPVPDATESR